MNVAKTSPPEAGSKITTEVLRDQLLLLSLLVVFVGIISTESYYSSFGLRYQFLDFPATHFVYRGVVTLINAWYLLIVYALAAGLVVFVDVSPSARPWMAAGAAYVGILALAAAAYAGALAAGKREARIDRVHTTSRLPVLRCIRYKRGDQCDPNVRDFRQLIAPGERVILFRPVASSGNEVVPIVFNLNAGEIYDLETTAGK